MPSAARRCAALLLVGLAVTGCDPGTRDFRHQYYAFGTLVTIDIFAVPPESDRAALAIVEATIRELDSNWYPWRQGELQRINAAIAGGLPIAVSSPLAALIRRAATIETASGGRFNATIGRLTELWGFHDMDSPPDALPEQRAISQWLDASVSGGDLEWDGDMLSSRSTQVMLDLGGIAKGSILEQIGVILKQHGVASAIIDIGGDLAVLGAIRGRPARIAIRSPRSDDPLAWLEVAGGETVVTSGDYERYFDIGGRRYQHVLDPATGYPVSHTVSATVVHRDPVLADAAATALLVGGAAAFEDLCRSLGLEFALIVSASGDLSLTPGMDKRLHWAVP